MKLAKKYQDRKVLHSQKFVCNGVQASHTTIILDPGCSDFGILLPTPFHKITSVRFDHSKQVWVKSHLDLI